MPEGIPAGDAAERGVIADRYRTDRREPPPGRPWVVVNTVASADGAISVDGVSGPLGGAADKAVFRALRSVADFVLVGAGTARAEDYGPVHLEPADPSARTAAGRAPEPRLAVVSGSLGLDPSARLFSDPTRRPLVLTATESTGQRRLELAEVADLVDAGQAAVDPLLAVGALHALGARVLLCEGGPTLNGTLLAADIVDEWCLTLAPVLAGGGAGRATAGVALDAPRALRLDRVLHVDGFVFLRYLRR